LTRAVLPMMRAARWGRIVNIVSSRLSSPFPGLYRLERLSSRASRMGEDASAEVASDNVLITCAAPGRILTARTAALDKADVGKIGAGRLKR